MARAAQRAALTDMAGPGFDAGRGRVDVANHGCDTSFEMRVRRKLHRRGLC